jgi:CRISPR-associated protein Cmr2
MTESIQILRMFVGPVQPFIAAGRRTRDLWAGSFLLSRLAGEAMQAVRDAGGRITLPKLDPSFAEDGGAPPRPQEETLGAIHDAWARAFEIPAGGDPPRGPMTGTLVNQFRAEIPAGLEPGRCRDAVRRRFSAISQAVFEVFIEPAIRMAQRADIFRGTENVIDAEKAADIRRRWQQQTQGDFFELLWVRGGGVEWPEETLWLARRKTWRSHRPVTGDIGADRCPLHPEMAELGGFSRIRGGGAERARQETFWQALRYVVGERMYEEGDQPAGWEDFPERWPPADEGAERSDFRYTLELRPGERLSGFALVKRLFPLLSARRLIRAIGWLPVIPDSVSEPDASITPDEARRALRNYPSTAFVAAIPWIIEVYNGAADAARRYADHQWATLYRDPRLLAERPQKHRIPGIEALEKEADHRGVRRLIPLFAVLDGTLHFPRGLDKRRLVEREYRGDRRRDRETERSALRRAEGTSRVLLRNYERLLDAVDARRGLGPSARPSPFYAFLEMDGDGMGRMFSSDRQTAEITSLALLDFAKSARRLVREHDGVPVYAGADDVLALLPVPRAMACASDIRQAWADSFQQKFAEAGLAVPDTSVSASVIFADYQVPLNDVRRTTHQRLDEVAKEANGRDSIALAVMKSGGVAAEWVTTWKHAQQVTRQVDTLWALATDAATSGLANSLPYSIAERFQPILDASIPPNPLFTDADLIALIRKELIDSGVGSRVDAATRERLAADIVSLLAGYRRTKILDSEPARYDLKRNKRDPEALLIARFLRQSVLRPYAARSGLVVERSES